MDSRLKQLPDQLKSRLMKQLDEQFPEFEKALESKAPVSIRLNPGKPTLRFKDATTVPWCAEGKHLVERPNFTLDPAFHAGSYYVQEASSMFLAHLLPQVVDLNQDLRVLDLSAAPGGKTTLLQSLLSQDSLLVANEIISGRNRVLHQNLTRWGGDNHIITQSDPRVFQSLPGYFDVILVDAPCSGEGLMRKDPSAIAEWSEQNVQLCASRQRRILADILPALASGGILVYSTCTFSETENEDNMMWLQQNSNLLPQSIDIPEDWGVQESTTHGSAYRFYPHRVRGEGFFIAAFKKYDKSRRKGNYLRPNPDRNRLEKANKEDRRWLGSTDRYYFQTRGQFRIAIPRIFFQDYHLLGKYLRITHSGLNMGKVYHGKLKPSPELALSQFRSSDLPVLELTHDIALDFLSHHPLNLPTQLKPGRHLVTYEGYGLGWLHVLKTGQIRNNYPSAWRILRRD